MPYDTAVDAVATAPMSLLAAADLQDNLMTATHDLDRLQTLLAHACDELLLGFHGAVARLDTLAADPAYGDELRLAMAPLGGAITAMQFQDMASQLIAHTHQRLRNCADRLAYETMRDEDDEDGTGIVEAAPMRPNPVTQDEMDAGSVELF